MRFDSIRERLNGVCWLCAIALVLIIGCSGCATQSGTSVSSTSTSNETSSNALISKGIAAYSKKDYVGAIDALDKALSITTESSQLGSILFVKASCLKDQGKIDESLKCYDESLKYELPDQTKAIVWTQKGLMLDASGRWDESLECFDNALAIHPEHTSALYGKANVLDKFGKYDEASQLYDKAVATLDTTCVDMCVRQAYFHKGRFLSKHAKYEEAIVCFNKCLEVNPGDREALEQKCDALKKQGKVSEAEACSKQMYENNRSPNPANEQFYKLFAEFNKGIYSTYGGKYTNVEIMEAIRNRVDIEAAKEHAKDIDGLSKSYFLISAITVGMIMNDDKDILDAYSNMKQKMYGIYMNSYLGAADGKKVVVNFFAGALSAFTKDFGSVKRSSLVAAELSDELKSL